MSPQQAHPLSAGGSRPEGKEICLAGCDSPRDGERPAWPPYSLHCSCALPRWRIPVGKGATDPKRDDKVPEGQLAPHARAVVPDGLATGLPTLCWEQVPQPPTSHEQVPFPAIQPKRPLSSSHAIAALLSCLTPQRKHWTLQSWEKTHLLFRPMQAGPYSACIGAGAGSNTRTRGHWWEANSELVQGNTFLLGTTQLACGTLCHKASQRPRV